mgnify:CR=1 FL=1
MRRYNKKYYSSPYANNLVSPRSVRPQPKLSEPTLARKITIYEYLANNVPSDCHFLINKYDSYRKARDSKELEYQLKNFVNRFGENGLNELAKIHPDKHLLQISNNKYSNISGESEPEQKKNVNIDVYKPTIPKEEKVLITENLQISKMLIFGGMILVGLSIIIKNK